MSTKTPTSTDPDTFHGWVAHSPSAAEGKMEWGPYTPKPFRESDIEIAITHCGICGTDISTLRSGWASDATHYPIVVGHEIIGRAVRVGSLASNIRGVKVGHIVGVGGQSGSCLKADCEFCENGEEQYCNELVSTYNGQFKDGSRSMGGYAERVRVPGHFVVRIPKELKSEDAAPMLCGGITVYKPLKDNGCGVTAKRVGIVGLGAIGHFGVLFAKALGAQIVTVISRSSAKKADAQKMGADVFIATGEESDWASRYEKSLDLIVSTVNGPGMPMVGYLKLLRQHGQLIQIGAPEDLLPQFDAHALIMKGAKIGGSLIGSPSDIEEMLQLAVEKSVKPWIEKRPMKDANQAVIDMASGKARYKYALVNDQSAE